MQRPATSKPVAASIIAIRGLRVIMDSDLAHLYDVETRILVQAVKRNPDRFPDDFCFQLDEREAESLRSQIVISNVGRGGRRTLPYAFTEEGVAMLSSVLRSGKAIAVNIEIMRAFVRLRDVLAGSKELAGKFAALERRIDKRLGNQDQTIVEIMKAIRDLMRPAPSTRRPIGFVTEEKK